MLRLAFLQLADSAFPSGGFTHSNGLEAAAQLGAIEGGGDVRRFLDALILQAGFAALPFALAAHESPEKAASIDRRLDAFLSGHVQNKASRAQGRSFLAAAARVFDSVVIGDLERDVRERRLSGHHASMLGASLGALGATRDEAGGLMLYAALRAGASAAVRLGLLGPHEAERQKLALAPRLVEVLSLCKDLTIDEAAQPSPALDVLAGAHDRLYSKLFQS